jgi:hypothetical protein
MARTFGKNSRALAAVAFAVAMLAGCGGASNEPAADEPSNSNDKVLGTVNVGYGVATFHEVTLEDGSTLLGLSETVPNTYGTTPVQKMLTGHTSLEVWKALMPDQPAPASLIAAQAVEAASLNRPNADVVPATFDKNAQIEMSAQSCANLASGTVFAPPAGDSCYSYAWVNRRTSVATSGDRVFGVIDNNNATTTANVSMGICNDSSVNVQGRILVMQANSTSYTPINAWATVQPGYIGYWYNFRRVATSTSCPVPGGLCFTNALPSAYRIEGNSPAGASYYLYTGVLQTTFDSSCIK